MDNTLNSANSQFQKCPKCNANIPINPGYVTWCDNCGWNVTPYALKDSNGILKKIYIALGNKSSKYMFHKVVQATSLNPTINIAKITAFVLALIIHLISIFFFLASVFLLYNHKGIIGILIGFTFLTIAFISFPKPSKYPKTILPRGNFPELYCFIDELTNTLGCPKINGITIDSQFNASYSEFGINKKRVINIGLPLFLILDNEEKVALLGHELAHGINGDVIKGFFIGTAINSLVTWYNIIKPQIIFDYRLKFFGIAMLPANFIISA